MKILLENLLRHEDGGMDGGPEHPRRWRPGRQTEPDTGDRLHAGPRGPAGLHRRALRSRPGRDTLDAVTKLGGSASQINPLDPVRSW